MSSVQLKTQDLGLKLSVCLQLLAWLYDRAHDSLFMERVSKIPTGCWLHDSGGEIRVREVRRIGPPKRYTVTLEYGGKTVMQANGLDLAELAKGMMRSVTENMAEQVRSVFAEEAVQ